MWHQMAPIDFWSGGNALLRWGLEIGRSIRFPSPAPTKSTTYKRFTPQPLLHLAPIGTVLRPVPLEFRPCRAPSCLRMRVPSADESLLTIPLRVPNDGYNHAGTHASQTSRNRAS